MRIISGVHKGRKIIAPNNLPIRPTTDISKESIFNILSNQYFFNEIRVLDLFTGSGNISYEFASRGVKQIDCVDNNFNCINFIKKTSELLNMNLNLFKIDVNNYLNKINNRYDIIFADPPYNYSLNELENIIKNIFERSLLNDFGVLIIEHSKFIKLNDLNNFNKMKKYGNCCFSFFIQKR